MEWFISWNIINRNTKYGRKEQTTRKEPSSRLCFSVCFVALNAWCSPVRGTIISHASHISQKSSGWLKITPKWCPTSVHPHGRLARSQNMESSSRLTVQRLSDWFWERYLCRSRQTKTVNKKKKKSVTLSGNFAELLANQWTQLMFQWTPGTDSTADALIG